MLKITQFLLVPMVLTLAACAHNIQISPAASTLQSSAQPSSSVNVGYYIAAEDKAKLTTSPGGGGDKISYYPYKDSEGALNTVLSNIYKGVYSTSPNDKDLLAKKQIAYIFKPTITTSSSSSSAFTWPPTDFSMTIECAAVDMDGKEIWKDQVTGNGHAEFSEFKNDLPLAARRASEDAFKKLQEKISTAPALTK